MRYHIAHTTTYAYSQSVVLEPHVLRLRPRCDGAQELQAFCLEIWPQPLGIAQVLDLEGNAAVQLWFEQPTESLRLQVSSQVETHRTNPFDYLLETWALTLPIDYPGSLLTQLQPYLTEPLGFGVTDPLVFQLAQEICHQVAGQTLAWLGSLNQHIYQTCQQQFRETGDPLPAGVTLAQKAGSCRDLAVLFTAACRCLGLAARFVSGYQAAAPDQTEQHLHAWAEVYLPGAGWRGYDPTQGLAVTDRHIALAASALPRNATPVFGTLSGREVQSTMQYDLCVQALA